MISVLLCMIFTSIIYTLFLAIISVDTGEYLLLISVFIAHSMCFWVHGLGSRR